MMNINTRFKNLNEEVRTTISLTAIALIVAPLVYDVFADLPDVLAEILRVITCIGLAMPIHDVLWGDDYLHRFVEAVKSFFRR